MARHGVRQVEFFTALYLGEGLLLRLFPAEAGEMYYDDGIVELSIR
jgi:hypothetical protein